MNKIKIQTYAKEIKAGNRLAFSSFFRENYNRYMAFALRYLDSKADATDILQDVFVKLWEKREDLDVTKSLDSYLYTSIRNRCLNFIRDHSNKYSTIEDDIVDENSVSALEEDSEQLIHSLIQNLPDRQKEAFQLSRFDGLQHDEIAEIMDVSARTVNNHIVAALKTLRANFEKYKQQSALV
ncbi:MAG: RNA polymerase sigma-70 factor [Balneolales bacterium]|nr:RNA polymerase sigma-70 factor [Balneolales bacterium]